MAKATNPNELITDGLKPVPFKDSHTTMRSMQMIFRIFVMSLLFTGSLSLAATITGTVTNKTTGKPAAGDVVTLLNPMTGMSESARATTDGHGHYSLEKAGNGPALLKATHQGADYFIAVASSRRG